MSGTEHITRLLGESIAVKQAILQDEALLQTVVAVGERCIEVLRAGHKLLLAGNGGSASDAQHIAAELVGRFEQDRPGLPALALTTNASQLTALSNDYGYDAVFSRQLQALGNPQDLFIGLSTSGNSPNVVAAAEAARDKGMVTVGMTGQSGGKLEALCDYCIKVPASNTARIQESHITLGHILCAQIEQALFE
jgi:D-sedoheptulose 7-phosphate isomerase